MFTQGLILIALLSLPLSGFAASPTTAINIKTTEKKGDPLPLKKTDLFEAGDPSWAPELAADPEDYQEEMELPERSAALEEEAGTITR